MHTKDLQLVAEALRAGQHSAYKTEAREAFDRVIQFCESSVTKRLAQVEEDLGKLRAAHQFGRFGGVRHAPPDGVDEGSAPVVSDTEAYATIEAWYRQGDDGKGHPALTIEFVGPFPAGGGTVFYYCRMPNARNTRGATRSEALTLLAKWCESEMLIKEQTCAICHGRKRDHAGQDHVFTYSKAAT